MPGSFFGRLFPTNYMHIIHSSSRVHWLRQVPKGLVDIKGEAINKKSVFISKASPRVVLKAYVDEFQQGFAHLLRCRSQEIVSNGGMVLTLVGRIEHPKIIVQLLGTALYDMVLEGIVEEEKLDHLNIPLFVPSVLEVKKVIDEEGSFSLQKLHVFETDVDAGFNEPRSDHTCDEKQKRGQYVSDYIRAAVEPILVKMFGEAITDSVFEKYTMKV